MLLVLQRHAQSESWWNGPWSDGVRAGMHLEVSSLSFHPALGLAWVLCGMFLPCHGLGQLTLIICGCSAGFVLIHTFHILVSEIFGTFLIIC